MVQVSYPCYYVTLLNIFLLLFGL
ncbi:hypothetical protein BpHYR1_049607 [Brachionus plicatilis]|uniref:Uncharacterized protein n=1 Tax=Brachionus plicatilis TaxID=10195 RepID=A0A3M7P184_BRAPC|nr:hypothetical protein BpHYR1_049607 [Brachionus plicatilis]